MILLVTFSKWRLKFDHIKRLITLNSFHYTVVVETHVDIISRCVEPEYSTIAGMFGAASIVTGMIAGIGFSYLMPLLISTPGLSFEFPEWWPPYVAR